MIFDGKALAKEIEIDLTGRVEVLKKKGIKPKLVSVLADNSPESALYVSLKGKFAERIGVIFEVKKFDLEAKTEEIIRVIQEANQDPAVHGVMIQLPVLGQEKILPAISPLKDVDCLTGENLGLILAGQARFLPATVKAVLKIIRIAVAGKDGLNNENKGRWLVGKNVCVVGASIIVGKPLSLLLSDLGATVTICRSTTKELGEFTRKADILVSATGAAELIGEGMVKEGTVVIDVGISKLLREGKFRVVGDVSPEVYKKASLVTPVPGGVGPVTVACLFENLVEAVEKKV